MRNRNTNQRGETWTKCVIDQVWRKGSYIPGTNSDKVRKDYCGAIMEYDKFGDTNHYYGWEIDHIKPVIQGGDDNMDNLQPLNWVNNLEKGDKLNWNFPR